jgi:lipopolysaccharide/colanic/teichoic acid biosynthesis glycosyltransferase
MKRAIDLGISLALLPLALPLCLLLMIAIRIETPGSPLFRQTRLGRGQKPFSLLKLRTMFSGTGDVASHLVGESRITRLGAILRRLKFDELPQLINVITGSMTLVGPRPCLPSQHELITERERLRLFEIKPGVTGPAQVLGVDMSEPARMAAIEFDYFRKPSTRRDLALLWETVMGGGRGDASIRSGVEKR